MKNVQYRPDSNYTEGPNTILIFALFTNVGQVRSGHEIFLPYMMSLQTGSDSDQSWHCQPISRSCAVFCQCMVNACFFAVWNSFEIIYACHLVRHDGHVISATDNITTKCVFNILTSLLFRRYIERMFHSLPLKNFFTTLPVLTHELIA
jgi:hypothetical protein